LGIEGTPMTAMCPNCSAKLPIRLIRSKRFECPTCSVRLSSSLEFAILATVLAWSLVEFVLIFVLRVLPSDAGGIALLVRYVLSGFIGLGIFTALAPQLAKVQLAS
jgi:hypothetical protein